MIGRVLLANEALKTRKRLGVWVTFLAFGGVLAMVLGAQYYAAARQGTRFALPSAWVPITQLTPLVGFFGAVAVILMVASEFTWKTARQNVIDGLSKDQWFAGKAMLAASLALVFAFTLLAAGFGVAVRGPGATPGGPIARAPDLGLMGGVVLMSVGYCAMAFLAAFVARGAGAAMGLFFLWTAILERLLGSAFRSWGGAPGRVADWLPASLFDALIVPAQYDLEARAATAARLAEAGRAAPDYRVTGVLWGAALGWIVVLSALAFWSHRARDL